MLAKVLAPSPGLYLLEKVLTKDTFFVTQHFELNFLLEVPEIILLATLDPKIYIVIGQDRLWWSLALIKPDGNWTNPQPLPFQS